MAEMKVIGDVDLSDIKRCYVDAVVEGFCPCCKAWLETDLKGPVHYLGHPETGKTTDVPLFCDDCDEWTYARVMVESVKVALVYDPRDLVEDK